MIDDIFLMVLTVCGIIKVLEMWGVVDYYNMTAPNWLPSHFCYFCFSFWFTALYVAVFRNSAGFEYILLPIAVAGGIALIQNIEDANN